ncbi:hypothetical protein [Mycobacterium avium]|uniref:hypothetical protein n=1 Tax=Mycobacterium avium TaxID=1764 RepID=UPI0011409C74|nr:hypothetical protein [Mycobacterium avium]
MSATVSTPTQQRWLTRLLSGQPHQVIEVHDRPYLLRWFLVPPNRFCNLYWHRFIGSDRILGRKPRHLWRGEPIPYVAGRSPAVKEVGLGRRCIA